jgi:hypothetical protein
MASAYPRQPGLRRKARGGLLVVIGGEEGGIRSRLWLERTAHGP